MDNITMAEMIINYDYIRIKDFNKLYSVTNENIKSCFNNFNFKHKNCLTVLGSSDQTLDMILSVPNKIDTFDLNPLTYEYFKLKKSALLSDISLDEYIYFFLCYESGIYDCRKKLFDEKLSKNLDYDSYKFWNYLFNKYSILEIKNKLFYYQQQDIDNLKYNINYLNQNNFIKLKKNINKVDVTFVNKDIKELTTILNSKYDFVYLSNIIQHVDSLYADKFNVSLKNQLYKLQMFKNLILNLDLFLNKNGKIVVGYLYNILLNDNNNAIKNIDIRNQVFDKNNFYYHEFDSFDYYTLFKMYGLDEYEKDACLVYQKKI